MFRSTHLSICASFERALLLRFREILGYVPAESLRDLSRLERAEVTCAVAALNCARAIEIDSDGLIF